MQAKQILGEVRKALIGKDRVLLWTLTAMLAGGHILLEDIPGVGKTTLALAFSRAMGLEYHRVQFTPDVLPSDVTGFSVYNKETGAFVYQPGAVLCNLFLADELNRATSRTQSALLEAMEEGRVTVDGVSHPVPRPFMVIATQNPTGAAGTQPLPDSQMDRFMIRLSIGYPAPKDERAMVLSRQGRSPLEEVKQAVTREAFLDLQAQAGQVYLKEELVDYIVALMTATRSHSGLLRGGSPRATLAVTAMAKSVAFLSGRDYVLPADVQAVFVETVAHRLLLSPEAEANGQSAEAIAREILRRAPAPQLR